MAVTRSHDHLCKWRTVCVCARVCVCVCVCVCDVKFFFSFQGIYLALLAAFAWQPRSLQHTAG